MRSIDICKEIVLHHDEFVILPNHLHAIVWINDPDSVGADGVRPLMDGVRPLMDGSNENADPVGVDGIHPEENIDHSDGIHPNPFLPNENVDPVGAVRVWAERVGAVRVWAVRVRRSLQ